MCIFNYMYMYMIFYTHINFYIYIYIYAPTNYARILDCLGFWKANPTMQYNLYGCVCVCVYTACFDPDDASQQMKTCEYTDKIHT